MIDNFGKRPIKYEKLRSYPNQVRLAPRKLFFFVLAILITFLIYIQFEKRAVKSYREELFRTEVFPGNNKKGGCISPRVLDSTTQESVEHVFDYFNKQKGINYNLCFSSLYFTIKSNQYDSFHTGHGFGYDELNEQCKSRNSLKCAETDGECDMIEIKSWTIFKNCR